MPPIDEETRSTVARNAPGLIDVYGNDHAVLLTVRREPNDVYEARSVDMTASEARAIAERLLQAADYIDCKPRWEGAHA